MAKLPAIFDRLRLPIIGAPMFIVSQPRLVIEQCRTGIVGSMPALNARTGSQLDEWLTTIVETLTIDENSHPDGPPAPLAINLIVHKSNQRLEEDLACCVKHKVPLIITSLGARADVNQAVHAYGGVVMHDVINVKHACKAIDMGADGLIAVAAGAGGHAGTKNPFALIEEIREWFDGPLALSGAIATGRSVLAAQAMGADFAYIGSPFIATEEATADDAYKQAVVAGESDDIVYSSYFTGIHANYLKSSIRAAGMDPEQLPDVRFGGAGFPDEAPKAWKDIWGCGQGIAAIKKISSVQDYVERLAGEYAAAKHELLKI